MSWALCMCLGCRQSRSDEIMAVLAAIDDPALTYTLPTARWMPEEIA